MEVLFDMASNQRRLVAETAVFAVVPRSIRHHDLANICGFDLRDHTSLERFRTLSSRRFRSLSCRSARCFFVGAAVVQGRVAVCIYAGGS